MLQEILSEKNKEDGLNKRWFSDQLMDLIVWSDNEGVCYKFQLCYDKSIKERALTWTRSKGYFYNSVDDGEQRLGKYKETPILELDGVADAESLAQNFQEHAAAIDPEISRFVFDKLRNL